MKDPRFLPIEKREPVEESEDYAEDDSDELLLGGAAESELHGKKSRDVTLYMAS